MGSQREIRAAAPVIVARKSTASIGAAALRERLDERVVGQEDAKKKLAEPIHHFMLGASRGCHHVLLLGPVGCGKATLGRAIGHAMAPHPSMCIEHVDVLTSATEQPAPQNIIAFVRNIDHICRDVKKLDAWLAACAKAGTIVVASAARSVTAVGLELMFDDVIELEALTKREIETAIVHPSGLLMEVVDESSKKGVRITLLPEAKRVLADVAATSGRGMNILTSFVSTLRKSIPTGRGDVMLDRAAVEMVLRDSGVLS